MNVRFAGVLGSLLLFSGACAGGADNVRKKGGVSEEKGDFTGSRLFRFDNFTACEVRTASPATFVRKDVTPDIGDIPYTTLRIERNEETIEITTLGMANLELMIDGKTYYRDHGGHWVVDERGVVSMVPADTSDPGIPSSVRLNDVSEETGSFTGSRLFCFDNFTTCEVRAASSATFVRKDFNKHISNAFIGAYTILRIERKEGAIEITDRGMGNSGLKVNGQIYRFHLMEEQLRIEADGNVTIVPAHHSHPAIPEPIR